jgi:1,4-dihydroxy-2-naphthoate octaprenyltransferase
LRDVDGDRAAGKKTLAARLGRERSSWLYVLCVLGVAIGAILARQLAVGVVAIIFYLPALRYGFSRRRGRALLPMLKYSSRAQLGLGALLAVLLASNTYWG